MAATPAAERTLVWMGDEQRLGWAEVDFTTPLPPGIKAQWASAVGEVASQAALTQVSSTTMGSKTELQLTVRLYAPATARRTVKVWHGSQIITSREIELNRGKTESILIPLENLALPAALKVTLDPDDLSIDDTAYLVIEPVALSQVLLTAKAKIDGEVDFIEHAISATRTLEQQPLSSAAIPLGPWPAESVVILRGSEVFREASGRQLDDFLARGGSAWLWVDGNEDQRRWLARHELQAIARTESAAHWRDLDPEHPALGFFNQHNLLPLLEVEFRQSWALASPQLEAVARWSDQTIALGEQSIGRGRLFLCGFPPTRAASDWPVRGSFVPFVHQVLTWLGSGGGERKSWKVGEKISLPESKGSWNTVDSPRPQSLQEVGESVTPEAPGLYQFKGDNGTKFFAVNLSTEESDLSPWLNPSDFSKLTSSQMETVKTSVPLDRPAPEKAAESMTWWWLLAAVGFILIAEMALANRTAR